MAEEIEEIEDVNFYKLGPKASNFYDPTQPKNKKVLPGQVVELEHTSAVDTAVTNKHIVVATKKDQKAYKDRLKQESEQAAPAAGAKPDEKAQEEADKLLADAKAEAKKVLEDAKKEAATITADAKKAAAKPAPAN